MDKLLEIVKNPITLGVVAVIITYAYLYYENTKKSDDKKKPVSVAIPGIVGSLVWFLTGVYFDSLSPTSIITVKNGGGREISNSSFLNKVLAQAPAISHTAPGNLGYVKVDNEIPLPNMDVFMDIPNF